MLNSVNDQVKFTSTTLLLVDLFFLMAGSSKNSHDGLDFLHFKCDESKSSSVLDNS